MVKCAQVCAMCIGNYFFLLRCIIVIIIIVFVRTAHDLLGVIMEATLLKSVTIELALLMITQNGCCCNLPTCFSSVAVCTFNL